MNKLDKHIIDEWMSMVGAAKSNKKGTCPLIEDETIIAVNNHINEIQTQLNAYENPRNWIRSYNYKGELLNESALYIPRMEKE